MRRRPETLQHGGTNPEACALVRSAVHMGQGGMCTRAAVGPSCSMSTLGPNSKTVVELWLSRKSHVRPCVHFDRASKDGSSTWLHPRLPSERTCRQLRKIHDKNLVLPAVRPASDGVPPVPRRKAGGLTRVFRRVFRRVSRVCVWIDAGVAVVGQAKCRYAHLGGRMSKGIGRSEGIAFSAIAAADGAARLSERTVCDWIAVLTPAACDRQHPAPPSALGHPLVSAAVANGVASRAPVAGALPAAVRLLRGAASALHPRRRSADVAYGGPGGLGGHFGHLQGHGCSHMCEAACLARAWLTT
eukprot:364930-Chlamydomonas_euryale.AAC.2